MKLFRFISFLSIWFFAFAIKAYDFEVDGIGYNILEGNKYECVVDCQTNPYLLNIVIPSTVKYDSNLYKVVEIGKSAFVDCSAILSIDIPCSVTKIGNYAFKGCTSLTNVIMSECQITSIGNGAFWGCKYMTSITIPQSVTSIGDYSFEDCWSLKTVVFEGSITEWNLITIGSNNDYLTSASFRYGPELYGACGSNLKWTFRDGQTVSHQ